MINKQWADFSRKKMSFKNKLILQSGVNYLSFRQV